MLKSGYGRFRSRWLVCRLSPPGTINACRGFSFFSPTGYHLSHARCPQRSLPLDYFEPISALSRPPPISVRFSIPINTVFRGDNGNRPRHTGPFRIFLCAFGIHSGACPHLNRLLFVRSVQFLAGRALSRPDLRHEPPSRTKVLVTLVWGTISLALFAAYGDILLNTSLHAILGSFFIYGGIMYPRSDFAIQRVQNPSRNETSP